MWLLKKSSVPSVGVLKLRDTDGRPTANSAIDAIMGILPVTQVDFPFVALF